MFEKELIGGISTIVSLIAYVPYIRNLLKGKTRPHLFSWLVWSVLGGVAFGLQLSGGAGAGAWIMGIIGLMSFIIFLLSFKKGTKDIQVIDWFCLSGAMLALFFWIITKTPLLSVIFVILTDGLAFVPTVRKSYFRHYEETILMYVINTIKFVLSILATKNYSLITVLYPLFLILANGLFVLYLHIRRKQIGLI